MGRPSAAAALPRPALPGAVPRPRLVARRRRPWWPPARLPRPAFTPSPAGRGLPGGGRRSLHRPGGNARGSSARGDCPTPRLPPLRRPRHGATGPRSVCIHLAQEPGAGAPQPRKHTRAALLTPGGRPRRSPRCRYIPGPATRACTHGPFSVNYIKLTTSTGVGGERQHTCRARTPPPRPHFLTKQTGECPPPWPRSGRALFLNPDALFFPAEHRKKCATASSAPPAERRACSLMLLGACLVFQVRLLPRA